MAGQRWFHCARPAPRDSSAGFFFCFVPPSYNLPPAPQVWFWRKESRPPVYAGKSGSKAAHGSCPSGVPAAPAGVALNLGPGAAAAGDPLSPPWLMAGAAPARSPKPVTGSTRTGEAFHPQRSHLAPIYFGLKNYTYIESKSSLKRRYPTTRERIVTNSGHGSGRASWQHSSR